MIACPACGQSNPEAARFCNACGTALDATSAPHATREERKVVSVVFADLVGSTAAAERSDPEDVRAMLAAHYERVRRELERFGGTVEKFIGDAVVAVFGAPVVHEDDPERAVRAALAIRDAARDAGVELRVAVNSGEALVSVDARPAEGQSMVAGDVMNTAARIQAAAPVNGVLVGEATYRATAQVIEYRAAEPVVGKGKREPIAVWEAVAARSRFGTDVERAPLAPMVGRSAEVAVLRAALARARQERAPQLVTVVGVPGIGKSRLVAELFGFVDADPEMLVWRQGRCLPYGDGVSYWALGEMVKAQAGVLETDTADEASGKLRTAVAAVVADAAQAEWVTGHLRPLVGLGAAAGTGGEGRGETFAAWRRFFEALAELRPTVLVFEDLHWADDGLLDFVDSLVDRATGVPLMVLCSARPELLVRRPGWGGGKANAATLSLSALDDDETAALIAGRLGEAVLPPEVQATLLRRADGNPLFAEEYVRMLRDRGQLHLDGGTWRVEAVDVDLPASVQGIIAARLDALSPEEKSVLQTAAVIGKVFWLGSVAAIGSTSTWETEERLHALERKELVRRDQHATVAGETEYAMRHALVRDVAYGQIPRARRADLHVRAARWIESLAEDRAEDRAAMRAHHYSAALDLLRAAGADVSEVALPARHAFREAGRRAHALSALTAAVDYLRRALELWPREDAEYPQVLFELGDALFWASNEGSDELHDAGAMFLAAGEVEAAAEAESRLAQIAWRLGRGDEARRHSERSVQLVAGLPDTRTTASIRAYAWRVQLIQGNKPSFAEGERILAMTEELGTTPDIINTRITVATGRGLLGGDVTRAIRELEASAAEALAANSHLAARAYINLGTFATWIGDLPRASAANRAGLEVARRFTSAHWESWLGTTIAQDDFYAGAWAAAEERAAAIMSLPGERRYMDNALIALLAVIAAARGDEAAARARVAALVDQARLIGDPQVVQPSFAVAARLAAGEGDGEAASAHLREAIQSIEPSGANLTPETIEAAIAAAAVGRLDTLATALAPFRRMTPWAAAGLAIAEGRWEEAGDLLASHGALTHAALVRLEGAVRGEVGTDGLAAAITFAEGVGATAWLERARAVTGAPEH
jgi:class 3 adenylate cyclase